jgi:hypothetical protein
MKTIIAEAESNKLTDPNGPAPLYRIPILERIPQRERRKMQSSTPVDTSERPNNVMTESARINSSPWKVIPAPIISPTTFPMTLLPSPPPVVTTPLDMPPAGPSRGTLPEAKKPNAPPAMPKPTRTPPRPPISQSGLGPIFIPSRQSPAKAGSSSSQHVSYVGTNFIVSFTLKYITTGIVGQRGRCRPFNRSLNRHHLVPANRCLSRLFNSFNLIKVSCLGMTSDRCLKYKRRSKHARQRMIS